MSFFKYSQGGKCENLFGFDLATSSIIKFLTFFFFQQLRAYVVVVVVFQVDLFSPLRRRY